MVNKYDDEHHKHDLNDPSLVKKARSGAFAVDMRAFDRGQRSPVAGADPFFSSNDGHSDDIRRLARQFMNQGVSSPEVYRFFWSVEDTLEQPRRAAVYEAVEEWLRTDSRKRGGKH